MLALVGRWSVRLGGTRCQVPTWSRSKPRRRQGSRAAQSTPRVGQRTQPPMRQPRRARRERVEMKHDERSRKADTEGAWSEASANPSQSTVALPDSRGHRIAPAPRHHGARGEISPRFRKISRHCGDEIRAKGEGRRQDGAVRSLLCFQERPRRQRPDNHEAGHSLHSGLERTAGGTMRFRLRSTESIADGLRRLAREELSSISTHLDGASASPR